MHRILLLVSSLLTVFISTGWYAFASGQETTETKKQVHGRELMTDEEFAEHRKKMQAAETEEEREQIRKEQHEKMKERAEKQGLSMPDEPPEQGGGKGQGR